VPARPAGEDSSITARGRAVSGPAAAPYLLFYERWMDSTPAKTGTNYCPSCVYACLFLSSLRLLTRRLCALR
jgi:hypothetical protein